MSPEDLAAIGLPPGEPFPGETLVADGWVYRDMAVVMSPEMWNRLLSIIGDGECRILAMSEGVRADGPWVRGQLLISPTGMENMTAYAATKRAGGVA